MWLVGLYVLVWDSWDKVQAPFEIELEQQFRKWMNGWKKGQRTPIQFLYMLIIWNTGQTELKEPQYVKELIQ